MRPRSEIDEARPPVPREQFAVLAVGHPGLGEGGSAKQGGVGIESTIDLGVDPGDEEAGHPGNVGQIIESIGDSIFKAGDVGIRDRCVAVNAEDQRGVDRDSGSDRAADRVKALRGCGDLDHHVVSIDTGRQVAGCLESSRAVAGQSGGDLDRHKAVGAIRGAVQVDESIASSSDVVDHHHPVGVLGPHAIGDETGELAVVVVRPTDRLGEDRRV